MKDMIYADNAATTKLDADAFDAMKPFLLKYYGNASQPYAFSRVCKQSLAEARATIANCINAEPSEIYFTSGGTESDNWAIKSVAFSSGKRQAIITSAFEHHAILNACASVEHMGYPVAYVFPNRDGIVQLQTLRNTITDRTGLVSVMLVNNELGTIQPIKELCGIAHDHGALFHTDAVQAVGHIPIDVKNLGIDMLSASAHKFNGPKGVGFLYVRKGVKLPPFLNGGAQENSKRAGTENIAGIVAMAAALKKNCSNLLNHISQIQSMEERLLAGLSAKKMQFVRNGVNTAPGIVNLSFPGADGEAILHRLDLRGICVSTGSACDSKNPEISHVLRAINLDEQYAYGTIRISLGINNTSDEVDTIVTELSKIISQ